MTHESIIKSLRSLMAASRPVMIWGPPGGGKTKLSGQFADGVARQFLVLDIAELWDPVDSRGLPVIDRERGVTVWYPPAKLAQILGAGEWVVLLDDLPHIPQASANALLPLILEGRLGGVQIDRSRVYILAAGNRASDAAGANTMLSALANRFTHINVTIDYEGWCRWALANGIETAVVAYHRWKVGASLYPMYNSTGAPSKCTHCNRENNLVQPGALCSHCLRTYRAFPTLRTWEFVSDLLKVQPDPAVEQDLIAGTVGEPAAVEFCGFLRLYRELPSIDSILMAPQIAPIPTSPGTLYAVSTALGRRASVVNLDSVVQYLDRIPAQEYSVLAVKDAVARDADITNCRAYLNWSTQHADVLI